jgi:SAM-dependent methyltransferase
MIKDAIKYSLNKLNLLHAADYFRLCLEMAKTSKSNKRFLKNHPGFNPPPVSLAFDAYNDLSLQEYYDTGIKEAKGYAEIARKYLQKSEICFLEWGCGPARIIRHMPELFKGWKASFCGTDYNKETISWCRQNISDVKFETNELRPPLAFNENTFHCILARSVFTHLSEELHYVWISELFRVLKSEGILIFTTLGDNYRSRFTPKERDLYESGKLITREWSKVGKKSYIAMHSPKFIRDALLKGRAVLEHIPHCAFSGPPNYEQDVWVAKKS